MLNWKRDDRNNWLVLAAIKTKLGRMGISPVDISQNAIVSESQNGDGKGTGGSLQGRRSQKRASGAQLICEQESAARGKRVREEKIAVKKVKLRRKSKAECSYWLEALALERMR